MNLVHKLLYKMSLTKTMIERCGCDVTGTRGLWGDSFKAEKVIWPSQ